MAPPRAELLPPDAAWFELRPEAALDREEAARLLEARGSHVVVVRLARPALVDDTLYPQLRKAERAIAEELERAGFVAIASASGADASALVVVVELAYPLRPGVRRRAGPPAGLDRAGDFLAAWPSSHADVLQGPYVRADGSLGVETREEERSVEGYLRARLPKLSLGRNLSATEGAAVSALGGTGSSEALAGALQALLGKRLPWPADGPAAPRRG